MTCRRPVALSLAGLLLAACGAGSATTEVASPAPSEPSPSEAPADAPAIATPAQPECMPSDLAEVLACEARSVGAESDATLERLRAAVEERTHERVEPPIDGGEASDAPGELDDRAEAIDAMARAIACRGTDGEEATQALYWMGRLRYAARRYGEAAALFDASVAGAPDSEVAGHAALLALDSLQLRARQSPEPAGRCRDRIVALAAHYRAILCGEASPPARSETCDTLDRLGCQLRRRDAEALAEEGSAAEASAAYETLARDPSCGARRADELLFNAAALAERAGDTARATQLREELAARFPESPLGR